MVAARAIVLFGYGKTAVGLAGQGSVLGGHIVCRHTSRQDEKVPESGNIQATVLCVVKQGAKDRVGVFVGHHSLDIKEIDKISRVGAPLDGLTAVLTVDHVSPLYLVQLAKPDAGGYSDVLMVHHAPQLGLMQVEMAASVTERLSG